MMRYFRVTWDSIRTRTPIYIYTNIYIYTYMYTYIYICVYIYTNTVLSCARYHNCWAVKKLAHNSWCAIIFVMMCFPLLSEFSIINLLRWVTCVVLVLCCPQCGNATCDMLLHAMLQHTHIYIYIYLETSIQHIVCFSIYIHI